MNMILFDVYFRQQTKGFKRHRADYFQEHARPKKLWIKSLNRNALRILTAMDVPKAYHSALNHETPERDLALKKPQMESLLAHFQKHFKDPRRNNYSYRASSLLVFRLATHQPSGCIASEAIISASLPAADRWKWITRGRAKRNIRRRDSLPVAFSLFARSRSQVKINVTI